MYHFQSVLLTASILPSLQTFVGMGPLIQFCPALTNRRFLQKTAHSETTVSSVCSINNSLLPSLNLRKKDPELQHPPMHRWHTLCITSPGGSKAAADSLYPSWMHKISSLQSYLQSTLHLPSSTNLQHMQESRNDV